MSKGLVYLVAGIGSAIGAWIPSLWGAGMFSVWGIIGGLLGAFAGIYVAYKFNNYWS